MLLQFGEKNTIFIYNRYKFIENDKIEEATFINATEGSLDPNDCHVEKCGKDVFKKLERSLIHTCWPRGDDEEDTGSEEDEDDVLVETNYCNRTNEVVQIFKKNCVICYERDSVYAFRQCSHQFFCEQYCQIKGDIDILKCVVCRT